MTTHRQLVGQTYVEFRTPVYDNTLGIMYDEPVIVEDVDFAGWYTYTPATRMDPPESEGSLKCDLSRKCLTDIVKQWFSEWPHITILEVGYDRFLEELNDTVFEDISRWEVDPE